MKSSWTTITKNDFTSLFTHITKVLMICLVSIIIWSWEVSVSYKVSCHVTNHLSSGWSASFCQLLTFETCSYESWVDLMSCQMQELQMREFVQIPNQSRFHWDYSHRHSKRSNISFCKSFPRTWRHHSPMHFSSVFWQGCGSGEEPLSSLFLTFVCWCFELWKWKVVKEVVVWEMVANHFSFHLQPDP